QKDAASRAYLRKTLKEFSLRYKRKIFSEAEFIKRSFLVFRGGAAADQQLAELKYASYASVTILGLALKRKKKRIAGSRGVCLRKLTSCQSLFGQNQRKTKRSDSFNRSGVKKKKIYFFSGLRI